ncbi:MAG: hypothetical protein ACOZNI_19530 [Myxococcota bacterium]
MRFLVLAVLASCSDYDLSGNNDDPKGGRDPRDSATPDSDTIVDSGTTGTGGTTDTDDPDTDTVPDGKIDVVLVIDVAYWYDCYRVELPTRTQELVTALFDSGANVGVSIVTYDDYAVDGEWWVAYGGVPYVLDQQLSTSKDQVNAVAGGLEFNWGGDGPGTGYEAMLQVATGRGYDQDCDGNFDADNDVKPYKADAGDAFGGGVNGVRDSSVPGTGSTPGVGFRDDSKRVVVVLAENSFRDRAYGNDVPSGTCESAASRSDAIAALNDAGAKFLGVNAYEYQDEDPTLQEQMEAVADGTSSKIDKDNDGARDDVAVLNGSWDWPATPVIVRAIFDLADR